MITVTFEDVALHEVRNHLAQDGEQIAFFLADPDPSSGCLKIRQWWPMPPDAFVGHDEDHVLLREDIAPATIKWAWDEQLCLGEVHSHGDYGDACFSRFDLRGFRDWVPHVRWRLRGRPYFALVTDGPTFDGLAWIDNATNPTQVSQLINGLELIKATGLTLAYNGEAMERWA